MFTASRFFLKFKIPLYVLDGRDFLMADGVLPLRLIASLMALAWAISPLAASYHGRGRLPS